jgi:hypothetical protein
VRKNKKEDRMIADWLWSWLESLLKRLRLNICMVDVDELNDSVSHLANLLEGASKDMRRRVPSDVLQADQTPGVFFTHVVGRDCMRSKRHHSEGVECSWRPRLHRSNKISDEVILCPSNSVPGIMRCVRDRLNHTIKWVQRIGRGRHPEAFLVLYAMLIHETEALRRLQDTMPHPKKTVVKEENTDDETLALSPKSITTTKSDDDDTNSNVLEEEAETGTESDNDDTKSNVSENVLEGPEEEETETGTETEEEEEEDTENSAGDDDGDKKNEKQCLLQRPDIQCQ